MKKTKIMAYVTIIVLAGVLACAQDDLSIVPLEPLESVPEIAPIEPLPVPGPKTETTIPAPKNDNIPSFHGVGKIQLVTDEGMVINDSSYTFAKNARYFTEKNKQTRGNDFIQGVTVGFRLDNNKKIIGIWKTTEEE